MHVCRYPPPSRVFEHTASLQSYLRSREPEPERAEKLLLLAQCFDLPPCRVTAVFTLLATPCLRCELRLAAAVCGAVPALEVVLASPPADVPGACDAICHDRAELFDAVEAGQAAAVAALVAWRASQEDVNPRDEELANKTPLILAAELGQVACVAALLAAPYVLVDAADAQHRTALSHAVSAVHGDRLRLVAMLLAARASPLALEPAAHGALPGWAGRGGNTPLHRAAASVPSESGAMCVRLLACVACDRGLNLDTLATAGQPNTTALGVALLARAFPAAVVLRFCGASHFHLTRTDDAQRYRALVPHLPPQVVPFFFADAPPAWTTELHRFCPLACRAAVAELLRCGARCARDAQQGAALHVLPAPLLLRLVATVCADWCSSPPWPFEIDPNAAAEP